MRPRAPERPPWRPAAAALLGLAVLVAHLLLGQRLAEARLGGGARDAVVPMQVAYVRELRPQSPAPAPVATPTPPPARTPTTTTAPPATDVATPADDAASAAAIGAATEEAKASASAPSAETPADATVAAAPPPGSDAAPPAAPQPQASATVVAEAPEAMPTEPAASAATAFAWPPSTRLSYDMKGYYRGELGGAAQVEWIREGGRYQVHLNVRLGAAFAPLGSRRLSSEGALGEQGLQPRLYEERTTQLFRDDRHWVIRFEPDRIVLPRGRGAAPNASDWPGVQDAASQFAQFTWLFTRQPGLLRAGQVLQMPLALAHSVQMWTYEVVGEETVATPQGAVPAWHIKPRRTARPGGDLTVALWIAPSLQYLPARLLIRQDAETYLDLTLSKWPEQGALPAPGGG